MKARFVILAVAAVLFSGCSSNNSGGTNSGGGGTSSFVGTWTCNDTLNDVTVPGLTVRLAVVGESATVFSGFAREAPEPVTLRV